jgi:hypothetical protein
MSSNRLAADAVQKVVLAAAAASAAGAAPAEEAAPAAGAPPAVGAAPAAGATPAQDTAVGNALTSLVKYIPTEVVALYVPTLAARQQIEAMFPSFKSLWLFWGFVCLTPLMFTLLFYNKLARTGKKLPSWKKFPWWKTIASTIAFAVWALAVPSGPYLQTAGASALAGLAALFASTLLSLFDGILDK